tara:strand:+ start:230 stop:388 length:159 start_codon:yes stop_codon:yes gene_type:complete
MKRGKALKKAFMEYEDSMSEEKYPSKKNMIKHEKSESKKTESREKKMSKYKK